MGNLDLMMPGSLDQASPMKAKTLTVESLTATRVPFIGTGGLLVDDADMTFATDTLTVTKYASGTALLSATGDVWSLGAGDSLVLPSGAGAYSQTFTGTTTDALTIVANSLTSGNALDISSTSTAAITDDALVNLSVSGANAAAAITRYGIFSSNTTTGTNSTNYGGYFSASGGTTNIGVKGLGSNTYGVWGQSTNDIGVYGESTNGIGGQFSINPTTTNTVAEALRIKRLTSGTAAAGIGGSMDWYIEDDGGTSELTGRISNLLTNAGAAAEASAFTFWTRTGGAAISEIVRINSSGLTFGASALAINAPNLADADYFTFGARDSDTDAIVEVARVIGATDPYFQAGTTQFYNSGVSGKTAQTTTLAGAATALAVSKDYVVLTGDAGANTLATITGGVTGQTLIIKFVDALVTITDDATHTANTVNLSAAFTSSADDVLTLLFDGTSWLEVSRSVN